MDLSQRSRHRYSLPVSGRWTSARGAGTGTHSQSQGDGPQPEEQAPVLRGRLHSQSQGDGPQPEEQALVLTPGLREMDLSQRSRHRYSGVALCSDLLSQYRQVGLGSPCAFRGAALDPGERGRPRWGFLMDAYRWGDDATG
ncbi:hypothetical protein NDU88_000181 [Pleurodeles waltl]|uniref:Uncharacterized protein n=1 Tax=Pleurodeles waltl TaxID=8319 RepID=A0AAV7ML95_PLEWA|nr:hypothetical protein NDU88_000181 [Pleurodeles waltl]